MRKLSLALVFLSFAAPAPAETLVVYPDGSGAFPTIQAAVAAAVDGDVVELAGGLYTGAGNRDVDFLGKSITVRSASGDPATCTLDCQGTATEPHRGFYFHSGEPAASGLTGISITGGNIPAEPYGGAVLCEGTAAPTIQSCVFQGNQGGAVVGLDGTATTLTGCAFRQNTGSSGGAVFCQFAAVSITDCRFQDNVAQNVGGAVWCYGTVTAISGCTFTGNSAIASGALELIAGDSCSVRDCLFAGNTAEQYGAALVFIATATFERCTFAGNSASGIGGALGTAKSSHTLLSNCTFYGNGSPNGSLSLSDGGTTMENCIVASGTQGPATDVDNEVVIRCSDIWGNAGGDWTGNIAGMYGVDGNISQDPLFCVPAAGDFTLHADSPCAPFSPPNPECDLIGAWPAACGPTPVEATSWGRLKATFRR